MGKADLGRVRLAERDGSGSFWGYPPVVDPGQRRQDASAAAIESPILADRLVSDYVAFDLWGGDFD